MVSPTKPSSVNTSGATYSAVPNPAVASPELNTMSSPDPNDPYANLSAPNARDSAYLSPEGADAPILGRDSMYMPAPSLISRDSTHESLLGAQTPNLPGSRSSWGSNMALSGAAAGMAGASVC
jgi:glucan 1,3-beta-glucosidase